MFPAFHLKLVHSPSQGPGYYVWLSTNHFKQMMWVFLNLLQSQFIIELIKEAGQWLSFIKFYLLVSWPFKTRLLFKKKQKQTNKKLGGQAEWKEGRIGV